MSAFSALTLLLVTASLFSFVNHRLLRLPVTIGVAFLVLAASLGLVAANSIGLPVRGIAVEVLDRLDFREFVLNGVLAFMLFAGALNVAVDFDDLLRQKWANRRAGDGRRGGLDLLVGVLTWMLARVLGFGLGMIECLLFGALISPTDPVAVLAMLRSASVPKAIEVQMAGEALFNDGICVVTFSVILGLVGAAGSAGHVTGSLGNSIGTIAALLGREVVGGLFLGSMAGWLAFVMLRSVDDYQVEILITVGVATGIYGLATALHMSGPLAVVVAGLLIGGKGRADAMSAQTVQHLDTFWELVDGILNVVLFVLVGFQVLVLHFTWTLLLMGVVAAGFVLLARFLSVSGTLVTLKRVLPIQPHRVKILTWGGLRGGLSLAMALSLGPQVAGRYIIQATIYIVVVFSIAVQGLTFQKFVRSLRRERKHEPTFRRPRAASARRSAATKSQGVVDADGLIC